MQRAIEFWFSVGSTYTYLSVQRMPALARARGLSVVWRPFDLRSINQKINYRPFADRPVKLAYMWRDVERRCAWYGLPYRDRPPYPIADVGRANRVAIVAAQRGFCEAYMRVAYRRWFLEHEDPSSDACIEKSLTEIGEDAAETIRDADAAAARRALDIQTQDAEARGIFGSPTFAVDGEIFWGDDRLEDALRHVDERAATDLSPADGRRGGTTG